MHNPGGAASRARRGRGAGGVGSPRDRCELARRPVRGALDLGDPVRKLPILVKFVKCHQICKNLPKLGKRCQFWKILVDGFEDLKSTAKMIIYF